MNGKTGAGCVVAAALAGLAAIASVVAAAVLLSTPDAPQDATTRPGTSGDPEPARPAPPPVKRMPVAGVEGYTVVIERDGSSYMEGPDGSRTLLASLPAPTPEFAPVPARDKPKRAVGRLVVLDEGVIDIPKDAIVTFTGRDRLITHEPDGTSTVYYVSGRIERRERGGDARPNKEGRP